MFPEVEVVAADMMDFDALDAALQGCDVCVLAPPSTELRVALGMNAINACCKQGATHIVLVSVLADGNGDLGAEFGAMEKAVEAGEAGFTVLRVPVFMQTLLAAALGAGALCLPHGQELAPVDVEDVARVVREICVQAGGASVFWGRHLDLTGPARLTCADMAKIASELVGRRVNARITTIQEFSRCLVQAGTSPSAAKAAAEHVCFATPVSPHVLQVTGLHTSFQQFAARHKQDFGRIS
jgi:NAD(P)H dehydrogenase (quinone)